MWIWIPPAPSQTTLSLTTISLPTGLPKGPCRTEVLVFIEHRIDGHPIQILHILPISHFTAMAATSGCLRLLLHLPDPLLQPSHPMLQSPPLCPLPPPEANLVHNVITKVLKTCSRLRATLTPLQRNNEDTQEGDEPHGSNEQLQFEV